LRLNSRLNGSELLPTLQPTNPSALTPTPTD
jgi:hypothetical protein